MRRASSTLVLGTTQKQKAHVVKLVNTLHSGCSELKLLEVRVFSWALCNPVNNWIFFCLQMKVAFLHTLSSSYEINNLISDISLNVKDDDFQAFTYHSLHGHDSVVVELFKFKKFLKNNKIDIVHTYDYIDAFLVLWIAKRLKIKVVFSNYSYHDELNSKHEKILKFVMRKTTMIFQTNVQKDYYISKYSINPQNHFKLLHAFDFKRYDNYGFNSLRDEFFIDDLKYLVATIGDFSPKHDVMNIFKMVRKLRRTGRNFMCLVAGEMLEEYDTYYDECRYYYLMQGLDNYISYIGHRNDTANILSQLDAFIYHSDNEAVAVPVIEAMVSGANIIVNDSEMIKELTHNGKYATLYKSGDADDFAEKTRTNLNNIDDFQLISEVVKEECRYIFSIEHHIAGLRNIYLKLIK